MGDIADFKLNLTFIVTEVFGWKKLHYYRGINLGVLEVVMSTLHEYIFNYVCELLSKNPELPLPKMTTYNFTFCIHYLVTILIFDLSKGCFRLKKTNKIPPC